MNILKTKLIVLIVSIGIITTINDSYGQRRYPFTPIVFKNYIPLWIHTSIDSTMIDVDPDGYDYDGYFHFARAHRPLIINDYAYIVHRRTIEWDEGALIEKIDLNAGKAIKTNHYDLRNNDLEEYPDYFSIDDNNELEILNFRKRDTLKSIWYNGVLSRFYMDTADLTIKEHIYPNSDDTLALRLQRPTGGIFNTQLFVSYLKDSKYMYFSKAALRLVNPSFSYLFSFIDTQGHLIRDTIITRKIGFVSDRYQFVHSDLYEMAGNRYVHLGFARNEKRDSIFAELEYFDSELNSIKRIDISESIDKKYIPYVEHVTEDRILIKAVEFKDKWQVRKKYAYLLYNHDGELLESFRLLSRDSFDFALFMGIPLRGEDGVLIMATNHETQKFHILKSDGKGNLKTLKILEIEEKYHLLGPMYRGLTQLADGDILLYAKHAYLELNPSPKFRGNWSTWIRFDAADLDISTGLKNLDQENKSSMLIYPNPADDLTTISFGRAIDGHLEIVDQLGHIVYRSILENQSTINIMTSKWVTGLYYIHVFPKNNSVNYAVKKMVKD